VSFNAELNKPSSHKINLLEFDAPITGDNWHNVAPGKWRKHLIPGNQEVIDDVGNIGFFGSQNTRYLNIQSVDANGTLLPEHASEAALDAAGEGWFYDTTNGDITIIIAGYASPDEFPRVTPGAAIGISSSGASIYYEDIEYPSDLIGSPTLSKSVNPLNYQTIQRNTPSYTLQNLDGFYDQFAGLNLYNQPFRHLLVFDGQDYSEAELLIQGRIKEFNSGFDSFQMVAKDPIANLVRSLPVNTFSNSDSDNPFFFSGMDDKFDGTPVPLKFGKSFNRLAYRTSAGNWTFADTTFNLIDSGIVVVDKDGVTFSHGGTETDGTFTGSDTTGQLYVTCTQSTVQNSLDVISHCMENYNGITFNSSNFDLIEWSVERGAVNNLDISIDKSNLQTTAKLMDIVSGQNQGVFDPLPDGRWTFRTQDPKRVPTHEIFIDEPLPGGDSLRHPSDLILSSVTINYAFDGLTGEWRSFTNKDFEDFVFAIANEFKDRVKPLEAHVATKAEAVALGEKIMLQFKDMPNIVSVKTPVYNYTAKILDNIMYNFQRPDGTESIERSRYTIIGVSFNTQDFTMQFILKQIETDNKIYIILDGGDATTDYDFYDGGDSGPSSLNVIDGGGA
jgi:hypothetical protein